MIATRFVPVLCVLFAIGLIPTLIHSYAPDSADDGRRTVEIQTELAGYVGADTDRSESWGLRRFESRDWTERMYTNGSDQVRLTVIRSFDAKTLYHHPELAVSYGTMFESAAVRRFASSPDIAVHELEPGPGVSARALYVLHYDHRFVEDPVLFQIRTAGELLFNRRKPMTLFFAFDADVPEGSDVETLGLSRVLLRSIESFLAQGSASVQ